MLDIDIGDFLHEHQLPDSYKGLAGQWFMPMLEEIQLHHKSANRTLVLGINGAQGSGKSTLAALAKYILQHQYQLNVVNLSLDDFYFTREERETLANEVHPLFATRGVPGTHDIALARNAINKILHQHFPVAIPRFNKALDDRHSEIDWEIVSKPVDIIIIEGWCLGSECQPLDDLLKAINDLEEIEDNELTWRKHVNEQLEHHYPGLFDMVDLWIMLKAPSFDCVYRWRLEQETKLKNRLSNTDKITQVMDEKTISRFIKFYQRITEHTLNTLPSKVNYLFELNENRDIQSLSKPTIFSSSSPTQWLVYTDMDGSLLDHHNYHFDEAVPTLAQLEQAHIPVIPVTSKTRAEVEKIRVNLGNQHPFIVENGAAVYIPSGYFDKQPEGTVLIDNYWVRDFVKPRQHWQSLIEQVRPHYADEFRTFADAGIDGIIALTGLNVHAAACAARREYGEPVSWHGNGALKQQFIQDLNSLGAHVLEGGRFLHVSGDCDKGKALSWLTDIYQNANPQCQMVTLGIGDSHNDIAMLEVADHALIIRSPVHGLPEINRTEQLTISNHFGPKGWAEGVNTIIDATMQSDSFTLPRGNHG